MTNQSSIGIIRTPSPAQFRTVTTAGDAQLKAQDVRTQMSIDGTGYNIGVISDGIKSYNGDLIPSSELPSVQSLGPGNPEGDEGTAILEIIHDIAPGANLYFYGIPGYGDVNSFTTAVNTLGNDCDIVVDDIYFPDEPFFTNETPLGLAIESFINSGGIYITSCGNERDRILDDFTSFSNNYHIFNDGHNYIEVTVSSANQQIVLQWKDNWSSPTIDLNLEVYNSNDSLLLGGDITQSYVNPPFEIVHFKKSGTYKVKIKSISGASNNIEFKLLGNQFPIANNQTNQIFGHSAYPKVISVAAYEADDENTTSIYSSIGPATMFSYSIMQWTTQPVPTITATSGVQTYVGINNYWHGGYPIFDGTSASAPHIAGLAALYFQKLNSVEHLNKSNYDFYEDLTKSGTTIGNETGGIWHDHSGFGKANILATINRSLLAVSIPVISPIGGPYYSQQTISITCSTPGTTIYYTQDNSVPTQSSQQYTGPFTINSDQTIKAKAFLGSTASATKIETYTFSPSQPVVTVTPGSGTYPQWTTIQISWPSDYECWYTETDGSTEPSNPELTDINNRNRYWSSPYNKLYNFAQKNYIKFQLKKDNDWYPVVYIQYDIQPGLHIAQTDDEDPNFNSFGQWYKWENNAWKAHSNEISFRPSLAENYLVLAQQD